MSSASPTRQKDTTSVGEIVVMTLLVFWVLLTMLTALNVIFPYGKGPICGYVYDVIPQQYGASFVSLFNDRQRPVLYEADTDIILEAALIKGQYTCFMAEWGLFAPQRYYLVGIHSILTQNMPRR